MTSPRSLIHFRADDRLAGELLKMARTKKIDIHFQYVCYNNNEE
jgi:hypothetical protein